MYPKNYLTGDEDGDCAPDTRFERGDESEGEYQARQFYERDLPRRGGKSVAMEMMLEELFRSRPDSRVMLCSRSQHRIVEGNQEIDCVVLQVRRETERAVLMDLRFSLEEDEVHEHTWWLPKSQFAATGSMVRIKRWILEKRLQEGQTAHDLAENLLANQPVKR